jgi:hypothetical protein
VRITAPWTHSAEDARGVLDRFAPTELDIVGGKKDHISAEFPNANFEAYPRARRRLRKHHRPALTLERTRGVSSTRGLHFASEIEDAMNFFGAECLDGEQMLHGVGFGDLESYLRTSLATERSTPARMLTASSIWLRCTLSGGSQRMA